MKNIYILTFFIIVAIVLMISLYLIEIPSPSTLIKEELNLIVK